MAELEEQISVIVTDAVQQILRLVGRDDVEVEDVEIPVATRPAHRTFTYTDERSQRPEPRRTGNKDKLLEDFLGTSR